MELTRAVCTTCGANVDVDISNKKGKCEACGNTYLISHALDLQKVEIDRTKDLRNYRLLLKQSIENSDYETMRTQAKGILEIIPQDFEAMYYFAFASKKNHSPKALERFYKTRDVEATEEAINNVVNHIIEHSDLSDYAAIKAFITAVAPLKLERYEEAFIHRKRLEDNYSVIPRDAFICHRSRDRREAEGVVKVLEKDGYQCWISYRNLRPNDNENYWNNIETAIANAKVFVVITSNDAMLSKDVQKELEIAEKLDKPKLEFKIDKTEHTSLFKHFFDGHKWIDATDNVTDAYSELKSRFYDLVQSVKTETKKQEAKSETPQIDNLLKRAHIALSHFDYPQAEQCVESALNIDVESGEAWYLKFLVNHKFKSGKQFIEFIQSGDDLENIIEIIQSKDFAMAKKFSQDKKQFDELTQLVDEHIDEYVDQVTMKKEGARSVLNSIIEYKPDYDMAHFKLYLFSKNIDSLNTFEARLKDSSNFLAMEAIMESDEFETIKDGLSDSRIQEYIEKYEALKEKLGPRQIAQMRKTQKKRDALIAKAKRQMAQKRFKKAKNIIKKLKKLNPKYKGEAAYYTLLCEYGIIDNHHLKEFLKKNENHHQIKSMKRHKLFKTLKNYPTYESFIQEVNTAFNQTLKGMKINKVRKKISRIQTRYRKFYSFNHFLLGLMILLFGLVYFIRIADEPLFGLNPNPSETLYIIQGSFLSIFVIMALTLILREIAFIKVALVARKLEDRKGLEKEDAMFHFLIAPIAMFIIATWFTAQFFITQSPSNTESFFTGMDLIENLYVFFALFVTVLIIYSVLQRRSEKLSSTINAGKTFRKFLLRPMIFIIIIAMSHYFVYLG